MSTPHHYPLLSVPSLYAKTSFLRALYAAGWNWCSFETDGALAEVVADPHYERYRYVILTEYGQVLFVSDVEVDEMRDDPDEPIGLTLTNSPAQFLAYGAPIWRRHNQAVEQVAAGDAGDEWADINA